MYTLDFLHSFFSFFYCLRRLLVGRFAIRKKFAAKRPWSGSLTRFVHCRIVFSFFAYLICFKNLKNAICQLNSFQVDCTICASGGGGGARRTWRLPRELDRRLVAVCFASVWRMRCVRCGHFGANCWYAQQSSYTRLAVIRFAAKASITEWIAVNKYVINRRRWAIECEKLMKRALRPSGRPASEQGGPFSAIYQFTEVVSVHLLRQLWDVLHASPC